MSRAVVVAISPGALEIIGGLPLTVRAVLALRAAGFAEIAMFGPRVPDSVTRLLERRCPGVRRLTEPRAARGLAWPGPVFVIAGDVLFDSQALVPVLSDARPDVLQVVPGVAAGDVRAAVCPGVALPVLLAELEGGDRSLAEAVDRVGLPSTPAAPVGPGLFVPLDATHSAPVLEQALLDDVARRATADSYLSSLIDRRLARPVTRLLLRSPVTPSQITLVSMGLGLIGAASLATVSYLARLGGLLALIASMVLDCVDGELARARFEQSAAGARLDVIAEYVVNLATFAGLAIGLARQGVPSAGRWAAVALLGGVCAAMATVHVLFIRPALTRGGDLHWRGDDQSLRGTPAATVVEKLASRDYTYLLFVFALIGRLEWFVYAAAAGSWAFVAGLVGYWAFRGSARRGQMASR